MKPLLETRQLSKTFGSGEEQVGALQSIDLTIHESEFVAVMGSSGSGKSTLLQILGGMERPTSGTILMNGEEMNRTLFNEPKATLFRRQMIGFVRREYAILRAIHLTPYGMLRIIVVQSALYGMFAAVAGLAAGWIMVFAFNNAFAIEAAEMIIPWREHIGVAIAIVVICIVVCLPMAFRLARLQVFRCS